MNPVFRRLVLPLAIVSPLIASPAFGQSNAPAATVFVDVNVVPMDTERVLPHQTVLVVDGKIAAMGTHVDVPANARTIDGHGTMYLAPGLADMHTHAHTRRDMAVFLANGVTTILDMGNASNEFIAQVRPAIDKGRVPGPRVYAAFLVDGSPRYGNFVVTTPEEARAAVRLAKANGYEFIKLYTDLTPVCFDAVMDEARRQHMPVAGHGVTSVGLEKQMAAGQLLVAHTEEFMYTVFSQPPAGQDNRPPPVEEIPRVIESIRKTGAFVTADLNTYATIARQWGRPDVVTGFLKAPESRYVSPNDRIAWRDDGYVKRTGSLDGRVVFLARFTKAMADADVPLVAGTDAPSIPGLVSGMALHDDLQALAGAGLTSYQVLATATRTPGRMIAQNVPGTTPFGTIAVGNRADLVLVNKNPFVELGTLRQPAGVMANGQWYDRQALDRLQEQVATDYAQAVWTGGAKVWPGK
ncbi:Imidazolonepropionase [Massilia sp. PDC64]|nr:amidohydrolase family protein [Massilia sp. PDC64]SDC80117.1 Imidazolonepropionase [Massilia sp. PDC64]